MPTEEEYWVAICQGEDAVISLVNSMGKNLHLGGYRVE